MASIRSRVAILAVAWSCAVGCGEAPARDGAHGDLRAAIREARADGAATARLSALATRLDALGPAGAAEVAAVLSDPSLDLGIGEYLLLVCYWSDHAPAEAARWSLGRSAPERRAAAVECAMESWARADPQAAARLLVTSPVAEPARGAAERALVHGWLAAGGSGLSEWLRERGPGLSRQRMLAAYLQWRIGREGPASAIRFAASLPEDDPYRLDALRQTALALATHDPETAARWCDGACEEGDGVRTLVAQRWAARDGPAAMRWAAATEAEPDRRWALKGAFRGWAGADRPGFARWLADQAPEEEPLPAWLAPVVASWASGLALQDPPEALRWAARIPEAGAREALQVSVLRHWRARDAAAAEAWLARSDLSQELRARSRQAPERPVRARRRAGRGGG